MKRKALWLATCLALLGWMTACTAPDLEHAGGGNSPSGGLGTGNPHEGAPPPAVEASRWVNTPGNKPLTWDSLKGKVVLVDLWTFW